MCPVTMVTDTGVGQGKEENGESGGKERLVPSLMRPPLMRLSEYGARWRMQLLPTVLKFRIGKVRKYAFPLQTNVFITVHYSKLKLN